jgi:hypothetical protein
MYKYMYIYIYLCIYIYIDIDSSSSIPSFRAASSSLIFVSVSCSSDFTSALDMPCKFRDEV